ncbi:MAG TPA: glycosyltransferase [Casimicrobiaceae bacterium]|nr:glycosyltransferase [Casimicrobiaceae bacterium]
MKISIIIPLFDRRNAGWKSLESALAQRYPRDRYEVVAVTARDEPQTRDSAVDALLARCDIVARADLDPAVTASEVRLYQRGHRRCTGDVVFFCEGHTVLHEDCCSLIEEHFLRNPRSDIAWAPRLNHAVSPLGRLVAMHNDRHQRRAQAGGVFSLGANSVIRRSLLDALGGLDARYLRFSETALFHRALQRAAVISQIRAPLATHYNDMTEELWLQLAHDSGAGRYAYYEDVLAQGQDGGARIRHAVYLHARRAWVAALLTPVLPACGALLLRAAVRSLRLDRRIAYRCYVLALGCADLAGYSRACMQHASQRRARQDAASDRRASARSDASAAGAEQSLDPGDDLPGVGGTDPFGQRLREIGQKVA